MRLYIIERLPNKEDSILLQLLLGEQEFVGGLFQSLKTASYAGLVTFVATPEEADYVLLPHNYFSVEHDAEYIERMSLLTEQTGKKMIVFAYGDRENEICIRNSIVLRTSQYKSKLRENEIIIPAFVEDLGTQYGVEIREKKNEKPIVGFAGWAGFKTKLRHLKYVVKLFFARGVQKQGIYFRKKALFLLEQSDVITTNFKIRSSYSGHTNDIEADPQTIRQEYISVLKESDVALAVKGDGNYSLRFFEILSLGRIPLFIDTETPLPLEHELAYGDCMLRIDYKKMNTITQQTADFWSQIDSEQYKVMQQKARDLFVHYLEPSAFYRYLFANFDAIVEANARAIRGY